MSLWHRISLSSVKSVTSKKSSSSRNSLNADDKLEVKSFHFKQYFSLSAEPIFKIVNLQRWRWYWTIIFFAIRRDLLWYGLRSLDFAWPALARRRSLPLSLYVAMCWLAGISQNLVRKAKNRQVHSQKVDNNADKVGLEIIVTRWIRFSWRVSE